MEFSYARQHPLPAANVGLIEVPFRGRQLKVAGDRTFDTWTVTILNDTDMESFAVHLKDGLMFLAQQTLVKVEQIQQIIKRIFMYINSTELI